MCSKEMKDVAEQGLYESSQAFSALRAVAFMLDQGGNGPFEWTDDRFENLGALLDLIADHGHRVSIEALDKVTSPVSLRA